MRCLVKIALGYALCSFESPIATDLAALVAAVACAGGSGWLGSACDGCSGCVGRRTIRVVVVVACCVAGPVGDEYLQKGELIMRDAILGTVLS